MLLHNILTIPSEIDNAPRVPFNTLRHGDRYKHRPNGSVSQIFFKGPDYFTIRRADGWLVKCTPDREGWNKMVIKVPPVRK
jgi:hypothetical protein